MLSGHCTCKLGSLWPSLEPAPPHDALKTDTKEVIVEPLLIKLAQWTNIRINDSPVHLEECFTYFKVEQSSFKSHLFNSVHFCKTKQARACVCVRVRTQRENWVCVLHSYLMLNKARSQFSSINAAILWSQLFYSL